MDLSEHERESDLSVLIADVMMDAISPDALVAMNRERHLHYRIAELLPEPAESQVTA